ncbi:MAG: restriction endonuclease subunit S [Oscillospiraceae bacterium]
MNKPELRFKAADRSEFPEWEEKKITELFTRIVEKNRADLLPLTIIQGQGTVRRDESDRRIAYDKKGLKNYKAVKKDDFIVHLRSFEGGLEIANQDGIVSPAYHVYRGGGNVCPQFYYPYFHSNNFIKGRLAICVTGVRDGKNIEMDTFDELILPCPSLPEQKKIATFLLTIDDIITTTQSELTAWEERKKGVMQKIFNREVRFKADDGSEFPEWEEKRLGDVTSRVTRRNNNIISDIPLTISGVYGLIDQRKYFNKIVAASDLSNYYLLKNGEFAYNRSSSVGYDFGAIKRLDSCECGAVSTLYICFSILDENNIYSDYLRVYFDSNIWNKYAASVCAEGARNHGLLNISVNDFFDMPVCIQSFPEQKKIADCLSSLDDVINQIKAEISAWKEFKKGLLQQMFV